MLFESIPVTDERARELATAVRGLDLEYRAFRTRVLDRTGISAPELDVLVSIPGEEVMTPKRLAAISHLTTSAMTALLDRLAAAGLLRRAPHPTDRRSVVVELTLAGERLTTDIYQRYVAKFEWLFEGGGCALDLASLIPALGRLSCALASNAGEDVLADIA